MVNARALIKTIFVGSSRKAGEYIYGGCHDFLYFKKGDYRICIDKSPHPFWSTYSTDPPLRYALNSNSADLKHCFNRIPRNLNSPYILDFEHILHLSNYSRDYVKMVDAVPLINEAINNENCKALIGPTFGTHAFGRPFIMNTDMFTKKYNKVLPAIHVRPGKSFACECDRPFTILNIGNKFWGKGTHIALEIFGRLRKKIGSSIKMILVCGDVPTAYPLGDGVELIPTCKLTDQRKDALFNTADVFLFPCLHDSFGVYMECLAYGLPVVSTNIYDKSEVVIDGQTGFLFDTPIQLYGRGFATEWKNWPAFEAAAKEYFVGGCFEPLIQEMSEAIIRLINDPSLLQELSHNSQEFCIKNMSIAVKNEKVRSIYAKALAGN